MATASSQAGSASVQSSQTSSSNTEESSIYTSCSSDGSDADAPRFGSHNVSWSAATKRRGKTSVEIGLK